ncbi:bifunctional methionine sulfoxide reductase B/A protein [Legionella geestiana]|uniref:Peptide methionine sulfoxide reductase MsrA n=1 Tax=Legionella geestiana TaxID=45065 RepID=A0A0W0TZE0_9GAMM|nr:bifunctional methionine sulfoxide reductase B/A protein [Legionella geestiana]KTD00683.1 bifunctional methionine sulfoxide reductase B/A protein [Legionella geestiana]QBS11704.1 bifunctional methionine sulfoxide reductase B/A protein [Legionella geestiana]QDQ40684.1 bifunctional methionine sulfoxide reductase B/A protein [Legionella geestiana]STX53608.1 bifunctional methionine sulfoxide reductase B/A protein [Legionella geestiana]
MADYVDKTASLTPIARRVITEKATEYPHSGQYPRLAGRGSCLCRRCGLALFRTRSQFDSGCGWPAFDEAAGTHVREVPDRDGIRLEIVCDRCEAHLGHVFDGEHFTPKNRRFCVNTVALDFVPDNAILDSEEVIVAGGCFWGVEYWLRRLEGVVLAESGYTGGHVEYPSYDAVCSGHTGHLEAVRVVFDSAHTDIERVLRRFFEIHDPTQHMHQGPDYGVQYQSAVFCHDAHQEAVTKALIEQLRERGFNVATRVREASVFWPAEEGHQRYYEKHAKAPYCHKPVARFDGNA